MIRQRRSLAACSEELIINSLTDFCSENGITTAWVQALGAVSKATISYYDQVGHTYLLKELNGEYEIVSCSGNITLKEGKPFGHLHIILSDGQYNCLAGHLMPGTVEVFACEFTLSALSGIPLERAPDADTGLALWSN
jgi:predicted DNA-binding protein with PD1-like motif